MYTCKHSQCHPEINVPAIRLSPRFHSHFSFSGLEFLFASYSSFSLSLSRTLFPFCFYFFFLFVCCHRHFIFLCWCSWACHPALLRVSAPCSFAALSCFKFARVFVSILEFASEFAYVKESRISENVGKHKTGILSAISNPCTKGAYILSIWHE